MQKCCKNCYHYEACNYFLKKENKHLGSCEGFVCGHFKDKSLIVELPCKGGDILFVVDYEPGEECIEKVKCRSIEIDDSGMSIYCETIEGSCDTYVPGDFGESIFLTRKEAKKALEE